MKDHIKCPPGIENLEEVQESLKKRFTKKVEPITNDKVDRIKETTVLGETRLTKK